jgi:ribulose-5-phosphate 4-epimerase/fuculose-1-phosphate aldolase
MNEEGTIKYQCSWSRIDLPDKSIIHNLNIWRTKLYKQGLIGSYSDGTGYGNISMRLEDDTFLITGTNTGKIKQLTEKHYTRVTGYNILNNSLTCKGPVKASSESLTHAIIYESVKSANAVVHIHSNALWKKLINFIPTTSSHVEYGTPEMALEIQILLKSTSLLDDKILVMAGHKDGLISFGKSMNEAADVILNLK